MVLVSFCLVEDKVDLFSPELDLIPEKKYLKVATLILCVSKCKQRKNLQSLLHKDIRLQEESGENEQE